MGILILILLGTLGLSYTILSIDIPKPSKIIIFPTDFTKRPTGLSGLKGWYYQPNVYKKPIISIVQGHGAYTRSIDEYEFWDYRNMDEPQGYMTINDINCYLANNPILSTILDS